MVTYKTPVKTTAKPTLTTPKPEPKAETNHWKAATEAWKKFDDALPVVSVQFTPLREEARRLTAVAQEKSGA